MNNKNPDWYGNILFQKKCFGLKLVALTAPHNVANETFHTMNGLNYQVPTGKVATIVHVRFVENATLATHKIIHNDVIDNTGSSTTLMKQMNLDATFHSYVESAEIPALEYVTAQRAAASDIYQIVVAEYDPQ